MERAGDLVAGCAAAPVWQLTDDDLVAFLDGMHRVQQLASGQVPGGNGAKKARAAKARPQADIVTLERELAETLGTRVNVLHGRGGKGRLVIHYSDLDALEGVLERLRGRSD